VKRRRPLSLNDENVIQSPGMFPRYIRLPKPGEKCPWSGLSRFMLADLCVKSKRNPRPPVKSFRLRRHKGDQRAIRLIDFQSLMAYLEKFNQAAA
jgi:hypothetical protein